MSPGLETVEIFLATNLVMDADRNPSQSMGEVNR